MVELKPVHNTGVHLIEHQLLPAEKACPLCGYDGIRSPVFTIQNSPDVHLLICRCGCMSASRMPRSEVLTDYYTNYYAASEGTATFDGSDRFGRHLFRTLGFHPHRRVRILDFGGGVDGVISRCLAHRYIDAGANEVQIALVDYNAQCERRQGAISVDCHRNLDEVDGLFDVVLASAIIEHIPQPREVLVSLLKRLCSGGRAYFRTPAMASIIRLASNLGIRIDFTYPGHVHDMGQAFWDNVVTTLNLCDEFRVVRSRPSIVETDFRSHLSRSVVAYALKIPWFVFRSRYTMVGGWEAVIARTSMSLRKTTDGHL